MKTFLAIIFYIAMGWHFATTMIYAFSHPEKTSTQIFLHIPKHFVLDFK